MQLTQQTLNPLVCPVCHGPLVLAADHIKCMNCMRKYPVEDNLPVLIASRATIAPTTEQI